MSNPLPAPLQRILLQVVRKVAENATGIASDDELQISGTSIHDDDFELHNVGHSTDYDDHYAEDDDSHGGIHAGGHGDFGVHITYDDLYHSIVFLTVIYCAGVISARVLKMPNLVGEIVAGIVLGPPLLDFVPNPEAWVLLGEVGLIILVLEAGIDIDVSTLKLIGTRGVLIATIGSILPIGMGMIIAWIIQVEGGATAIIAAGAVFGPTSLGIALNILRSGGILNTPVGQLIISAAVIDDMIALIVLSQLESLTGEINVTSVLIPVISALLYLLIGGYVAIFLVPPFMEKHVFKHLGTENKDRIELSIMFAMLLALMPATYYSKASYLMGAFVAGLSFCTSHELHVNFVRQFKRLLQWLMRIFFAASIGFQVPIKDFADVTVIWQGAVFTLALLGKLAVGFMVPNFTQSSRFTNLHLRDCLITGFSMAAEGEFAFVIAVFGVMNEMIDKDLYASVVLAVLISTIIPPFLLRFTISYYNKKAEEAVKNVVKGEMRRKHDLQSTIDEPDKNQELEDGIRDHSAVFLCIQTQSESSWGLMHSVMGALAKLGLEVIDHRAWSPRGINTTLVNEIYAKDTIEVGGDMNEKLKERIKEISEALKKRINQPGVAKVKVQRWFPGVVEEYGEVVDENNKRTKQKTLNLEQRLMEEAAAELERKQALQVNVTQEKTVEQILKEMGKDVEPAAGAAPEATAQTGGEVPASPGAAPKGRRRRQKMRSTPVVGGGLFGEGGGGQSETDGEDSVAAPGPFKSISKSSLLSSLKPPGRAAEIIVDGEVYKIRLNDETLKNLRRGYRGEMLDSRGIAIDAGMAIEHDDAPIVSRLQGYVRNFGPLGAITEDLGDGHSEVSSDVGPPKEAPAAP